MTSSIVLMLTAAVLLVGLAGLRAYLRGVSALAELQTRTALDVVEARAARLSVRFDARFRRTRPGRALQRRLDRADVRYQAIDVGLALAALSLLTFLVSNRFLSWWFAILAAVLVGRASLIWLDRREEARREKFIGQLPEIARLLSNATGAGFALRSAIRMAANEIADPAARELTWLCERLAVGAALEEALEEMEQRLPSRELSLLTRTLVIQARAGGAVVTALKGMSLTLEARKDLRRELVTMLSGAVFTSYIVLFIGAGSLVMLNALSPGTLERMTSSLVGQAALLVSGSLYAVGFLLIRRQTRIEV